MHVPPRGSIHEIDRVGKGVRRSHTPSGVRITPAGHDPVAVRGCKRFHGSSLPSKVTHHPLVSGVAATMHSAVHSGRMEGYICETPIARYHLPDWRADTLNMRMKTAWHIRKEVVHITRRPRDQREKFGAIVHLTAGRAASRLRAASSCRSHAHKLHKNCPHSWVLRLPT
jgi:hypothetical protein